MTIPFIVTCLIFLIGFIGSFLPVLPGTAIVLAGIVMHKLWVPEHSVSWTFVIVATVLTILAQVLDWLCAYWGARKFGGSWKGGLGAFLGILIGPFVLSPFLGVGVLMGIIIGPVIGAIVGELLGGNHIHKATKAGFGTIIGGIVSFVLKLGISAFMIGYFLVSYWSLS
ncbi:MAG: DUF456 domain-containing protein [Verrucomicrobia bacterium CG_4_10_14_3_um_filter_43_23]|nr:MAG: hypothetical protein AUJ82_03530 [Verrucomicrobia bacterium CG1_02_43_26]PIP58944.1 MAG: hypothetical protein COX01_06175 [Verrucomicrobia bacterium CG22_combo_CG10-13_8_21_14_all_43_17]PIX57671.1 MAG: DUF456 domain-containing protein [Verrucomicrobia bacterium CG_4_10_14_3_um_filter_43_23]PIY61806.1 MAG: DUF456 domain-containing protein [Verrucomicrobia bacterium CG_4_10_14_0_8_um_filter_43_34]PJA44755.1 MAG: DUF456 domain-containing protein [Verrucomicrobia bacterium CG_4_9_14_3_um_fi